MVGNGMNTYISIERDKHKSIEILMVEAMVDHTTERQTTCARKIVVCRIRLVTRLPSSY